MKIEPKRVRSRGFTVNLNANRVLGWHILDYSGVLGYGDGRVVKVGRKMEMIEGGSPELCTRGMHASHRIHRTMRVMSPEYDPQNPIMCRVLVEGDITDIAYGKPCSYKFVGRYRTVLWMKRLPRDITSKYFWSLDNNYPSAEKPLLKWAYENGCPFVYTTFDGKPLKVK